MPSQWVHNREDMPFSPRKVLKYLKQPVPETYSVRCKHTPASKYGLQLGFRAYEIITL